MRTEGFSTSVLLFLLTLAFMVQAGCATAPRPEGPPVYAFYPAPPDEPRFQFLVGYKNARDIGEKKRSSFTDHILGRDDEEEFYTIVKPYGIAMHDGKVYVCDTQQKAVAVLDIVNRRFSFIGLGPSGKLRKPINVYVDDDGKKYVTDTGWSKVLIYDENDRYYGAIGAPEKLKPASVLVMGDEILITDRLEGEIEIWDKNTLQYKGALGEAIGEEVSLDRPLGLTADDQKNLYVVESMGFKITVFDEEGHLLRSFGEVGDGAGYFARPRGIAVDREGRIYVVDAAFANVQVFDSEGTVLTFIGRSGNEPGDLVLPADIAIDYENVDLFRQYVHPDYDLGFLLLVTSQYGSRNVNVYGYVSKKKQEFTP